MDDGMPIRMVNWLMGDDDDDDDDDDDGMVANLDG